MPKQWWILGALGASAGMMVVSGTLWWHSTADLDAVAERARAMGIPASFEDIPNPEIADPAEVVALTAIGGLAEPLLFDDLFSDADGLDGDLFQRLHHRGDEPDPLQAMAMAHQRSALDALRAALDALPDRPIRAGEPRDGRSVRPWLTSVRQAVRALQPSVRWGGMPAADLARMTRVCEATPQSLFIDRLVVISARGLVLASAGRMADRIPPTHPMVAIWARWAEEPILDPWRMHQEYRIWSQECRTASGWDVSGIAPFGDPPGWFHRAAGAIAFRRGRAGALEAHLDLFERLAATTAPAARRAIVRAMESDMGRVPVGWRRALLDPEAWTLGLTMPALDMVATIEWKQRILAGLVVALVRGEPIPRDPTDPAGGDLRRRERDGALIGFYACGADGIDNGGTNSDWCLWLDRPWDPPPAP